MSAPKVVFFDREYVIAHGVAPRGRGSWAFGLAPYPTLDELFWAPPGITFGEARRVAKKHYQALCAGADEVVVWVQP